MNASLRSRSLIAAAALGALLAACSSSHHADDSASPAAGAADTSAVATAAPGATVASPAAPTDTSAAAAAPAAATDASAAATAASPAAGESPAADANAGNVSQCDLIANGDVEATVHAKIQSIKETANDTKACTYRFADSPMTQLEIDYAPKGGADELDSTRKGVTGAQAVLNGIMGAATANDKTGDGAAARAMVNSTPPPDLPKVADDSFGFATGPVAFYYARKGDGYVQVTIGFPPDGVSRWSVGPPLASKVLAAH